MRVEQLGDPLRHVEARALIVEPDRLVAERLIGERRAIGGRRQRDDRVGMRVIDVRCVHERVQERLDGRARLVGLQGAAAEVVDHGRVVHRLSRAERLDLVEPQRGEPDAGDRRQIGA